MRDVINGSEIENNITMTYLNEFDCHYGVIMELYRVSVSMSIFYAT